MKTLLFLLAIITGLSVHAATNDGLLLYCAFDGSANATFACGNGVATSEVPPEFLPGVRGQALVIGGSTNAGQRIVDGLPVSNQPANNCYYAPDRNFDVQKGSISFWLKPLDWDGQSKGFNVFFRTGIGPNFFMLYRFFSDDRFLFLRGEQEKWTSTEFRLRDWTRGQWHHVVATWSPAELRMFIDGHLVCRRQVRFPLKNTSPVEPLSVGPGGSWAKAFNGRSLVDEFRIYNHPLSEDEIARLYLQDADAVAHESGLITIGETTPRPDGRIDEGEYAFDSTGLAAPGQSVVSMDRSRYALGYDRSNLCVAVRSELDMDGQGRADAASPERVELYLCPLGKQGSMWKFVFTPDSREARATHGDGPGSAGGVCVLNTISNGTWLLEAAVPFAGLGLDAAPDGQAWRMNLARVYGAKGQAVSLAPVVGPVSNRSHFITLVFRPDAPLVRIADWSNLIKKQTATDVSIRRASDRADIRLETISDTTEAYGLKSTTYPLFTGGAYTPHKSPVWATGAGADFNMSDSRIVETRDGQKTTLYLRKSISESKTPLKVFFLYTHDQKQLVVSALRRSNGQMRVRFLRPDGACAFLAGQELPADASYFKAAFDLDFKALVPGTYTIKIAHVAPDGAVTDAWEQDYRIPAPDAPDLKPYVDEEADKVPAPWTAVRVSRLRPSGYGGQAGGEKADDSSPAQVLSSEFRVSTWGRTYDYSAGFLFSSLVSQGEEMLAGPAVLRLNGTELAPVTPAVVSPASANDLTVVCDKTTDLGALTVSNRIQTHFDGYCEIVMTLAPAGGTQAVKSLSLDIPLRGEVATLVRDQKLSALIGGKSGAVGDYWCQGLADGPAPFFWVGNNRVGFNWLAPDLDGWRCQNRGKHVELIRQGDTVVMRFNLMDTPGTLKEPTTIRFGFTLTPSRPLDLKMLRRREGKDMQLWCQPWKCFAVPDYETADRAIIEQAGTGVDEVFLYLGVELTSPFSAEWPWFVEEWLGPDGRYGEWTGSFAATDPRNRNTYTGAPLAVDSFFNWMQNKRHTFFEKAKTPIIPKARSYYFDTGPQVNARYREQAINVYRMIRRTGPEAHIWAHQGWPRVMPMQHFADIFVGGEGVDSQVGQKGNYYDVLTPEMFRATFSPYLWGIKMVFLDMGVRSMKENHPDRLLSFSLRNPDTRRALLHSYGYTLVHDVDIHDSSKESRPLRTAIWAAQDTLGWDERVIFHPYWEQDAIKLLSPKSSRIMASAYAKDGKMLLAVLNDTDKEETVTLGLDLAKLGLNAGLKGHDVWQPEATYTLSSSWESKLPPRGFRLVQWPSPAN